MRTISRLALLLLLASSIASPQAAHAAIEDLLAPLESIRVPEGPHALVLTDLNLDGIPDLAVASFFADSVSVLLGRGDGTFDPPRGTPAGNAPSGIVAGDFTGDGIPDLAVSDCFENSALVLVGDGHGAFSRGAQLPAGREPQGIAVGDIDADGKLDLAVANSVSGSVTVLRGLGGGQFSSEEEIPTGTFPTSLVLHDLNGDGRADLAVANYNSQTISVLLALDTGGFGPKNDRLSGGYPTSIRAGDLNGDGRADLVTANHATRVLAVHIGLGDGTFDAPRSYPAGDFLFGLAVADLDRDGNEDVAVCDAGPNTISVLLGNGDGSLQPMIVFPTEAWPMDLVIGDMNGDQAPDVAVANRNEGTVFLWRNLTAPPAPLRAIAFLRHGEAPVVVGAGPPFVIIQVQPVAGAFAPGDIDLASIRMRRIGTSDAISSVASKSGLVSDTNHDDIPEISCAFAREDLARLLRGTPSGTVDVAIQGTLITGATFEADMTLRVVSRGHLEVTLSPNPLRTAGIARIVANGRGRLRMAILDVRGRVIRRMSGAREVTSGVYELPLDPAGLGLSSSGIYFYRVETDEGRATGKFVVVK